MPASQDLMTSSNTTNLIHIYRSMETNKPRIGFIVTTLRNICNLQSTNRQAYNKINRAFTLSKLADRCERISDCGTSGLCEINTPPDIIEVRGDWRLDLFATVRRYFATSASFGTSICIKASREGHCWKQVEPKWQCWVGLLRSC